MAGTGYALILKLSYWLKLGWLYGVGLHVDTTAHFSISTEICVGGCQVKKRHRRSNSADVAVMSTVAESEEDSECRSRRYSTPAHQNTAPPRAESAGNLHDIGLYYCY